MAEVTPQAGRDLLRAALGPPPWRVWVQLQNTAGQPLFGFAVGTLHDPDDTLRLDFRVADLTVSVT